jgi:hypothetical protein
MESFDCDRMSQVAQQSYEHVGDPVIKANLIREAKHKLWDLPKSAV